MKEVLIQLIVGFFVGTLDLFSTDGKSLIDSFHVQLAYCRYMFRKYVFGTS